MTHGVLEVVAPPPDLVAHAAAEHLQADVVLLVLALHHLLLLPLSGVPQADEALQAESCKRRKECTV